MLGRTGRGRLHCRLILHGDEARQAKFTRHDFCCHDVARRIDRDDRRLRQTRQIKAFAIFGDRTALVEMQIIASHRRTVSGSSPVVAHIG
jgi:hypothetical protein